MSGWRFCELGTLTEAARPITYGVVKPGDAPTEGGVTLVRGGDILGGKIASELRTVSAEVSAQYRRTLLQGGELLVSLVGNPGAVAIAPPGLAGANLARQVGLVSLRSDVDTRFIMYAMMAPGGRNAMAAMTKGSVQQVINLADLKRLLVPVPPLDEQRRIASMLGAYDDLIEVNRRRLAVLEAMARGLFEEWFVRFRFPRHENHKIIDTPDGPLPEGWHFDPFESILEHTIGGLWGSDEPTDEEDQSVCVIRGTDFPRLLNGNFASVPQRFVTARLLSERVLRAGDIVLEASGGGKDQPVGRTIFLSEHLLQKIGGAVAPASFCRLVRAGSASGTSEYVFFLLQRMYQDGRIEKFQKQSTGLRNLSMRTLTAEKIMVPDTGVRAAFGKFVTPWLDLAASLRSETAVLADSRDLLLPRLISGELSVASAEAELEAAA